MEIKNNILSPLQNSIAEYMQSKAGELIEFEDLLTRFWQGQTNSSIENDRRMVHKAIAQIRKKLGQDRIKTVIGKGYIWLKETNKEQLLQGIHESIVIAEKNMGGTYTLARVLYAAGGDYVLEVTQVVGNRNVVQNYNRTEFEKLVDFVSKFK